jgi:hypothetical protein
MKKLYVIFYGLIFFISLNVSSQNLIHAHFIQKIPKSSLALIPGLTPLYDVDAYYVLYSTVDGKGDSTFASGLCLVPSTDTCNFFPLISYQHGTVMKKEDVPSRLSGESLIGQIFCTLGNIALCPDFVGLGDGPGLHPYCHGLSEATATVDLIRAAREFMNDSLGIYDNGQVFLTGYSQGGHATMAAHQYIEENNLMSEIQVVASAPCSGPYHLSGAQAEMIFNTPDYPSPAYLVYLLFAYNSVYENLFDNPDEILKPPYDLLVPPYLNGNYSHSQLNSILPDSLHMFLTDSFYQSVLDDMHVKLTPFWQNLLVNDNYNWLPSAPVRLYYCQADEQVSYLNSIHADSAMNALGAFNVQTININPSASHGDCGIPAIITAYYWFDTFRLPCTSPASVNYSSFDKVSFFPNPAFDRLEITGLTSDSRISCYDLEGKLLFTINCNELEHCLADVSKLNNGLYLLKIGDNKNEIISNHKFLISR